MDVLRCYLDIFVERCDNRPKPVQNTGKLKKKVTHSYVCNEVTSEPTITPYTTIVRKTLKIHL
jgi:hypothetical protein